MKLSDEPKFKAGDVFRVNTNAEFLNEAFGTSYKVWRKSYLRYPNNAFLVWFVCIDGKQRNGFSNTWLNQDAILQSYEGTESLLSGEPFSLDMPRLVFEKFDGLIKKYVFKGVFIADRNISTPKKIILKKVSDNFPIN